MHEWECSLCSPIMIVSHKSSTAGDISCLNKVFVTSSQPKHCFFCFFCFSSTVSQFPSTSLWYIPVSLNLTICRFFQTCLMHWCGSLHCTTPQNIDAPHPFHAFSILAWGSLWDLAEGLYRHKPSPYSVKTTWWGSGVIFFDSISIESYYKVMFEGRIFFVVF